MRSAPGGRDGLMVITACHHSGSNSLPAMAPVLLCLALVYICARCVLNLTCLTRTALVLALLLTSLPAGADPRRARKPKQEIWYHTGYPGGVVGPNQGMSAMMGPTKMPNVFAAIVKGRLVPHSRLHTDYARARGASPAAPPVDLASLRRVHSDRYLNAILSGKPKRLACSQGLSSWNKGIARGWLLNVGGLYQAAETALRKKSITANLGHGYHHAGVTRGMGYCTVNGLAVVADKLIRAGKARRVMVIDLDQHEGNGTAECIIGRRGITNVSIYGSYMGGPKAAPNNHVLKVKHSRLPKGKRRDVNYLAAVSSKLPALIKKHKPDLILYQAGMDPNDCAGISANALAARDAYVFSLARSRNIPVTWVLAGGYSDMKTLVKLHTNTVRAANRVLDKVKPGDRVTTSGSGPYRWSARSDRVSFPDWVSLSGSLKVQPPAVMNRAEVREYGAARRRIMTQQRLPGTQLQAAYRALFAD